MWAPLPLPEGLQGYPPHCIPSTGGNPRIRPGSSVVVVLLLHEGVAWYSEFRSARSVVVLLRRAQRLRATLCFVDLPVSVVFQFLYVGGVELACVCIKCNVWSMLYL